VTERDKQRLFRVHPALVTALEHIFDQMAAEQAPMFVVQGVRTMAEQAVLYAQGRTAPGRIVTMKDGVTHPSNHQPHIDGFGYAVDCAFLGPQPFDPRHPWETYGELVEAAGLIWGGRWSHPSDSPHAELPEKQILKA
jgi:peptidoglycan L-alanyl-D-glutamate endopeptidase CwlK